MEPDLLGLLDLAIKINANELGNEAVFPTNGIRNQTVVRRRQFIEGKNVTENGTDEWEKKIKRKEDEQ